MADPKPVAKPATAQTKTAEAPTETDIDAGASAYVDFEPDPAKPDWENQRDQHDESATAAFGRPYAELSNVEQSIVHAGFDTGVAPQNPAGVASAPVVEQETSG